jgi:hypothetical protein
MFPQELYMTIQDATAKGFLNLSEEEANTVLETLFDNDDTQQRLEDGLTLLLTVVPEDKAGFVLDLAGIILDAYDELDEGEEGEEEEEEA